LGHPQFAAVLEVAGQVVKSDHLKVRRVDAVDLGLLQEVKGVGVALLLEEDHRNDVANLGDLLFRLEILAGVFSEGLDLEISKLLQKFQGHIVLASLLAVIDLFLQMYDLFLDRH